MAVAADLLQDVFKTIEAALKAFPELSIFLKIVEVPPTVHLCFVCCAARKVSMSVDA